MDQRTKEDALLKKLKDPDDKASDNKAISKLIDDTIHSKHKVYLVEIGIFGYEKRKINQNAINDRISIRS